MNYYDNLFNRLIDEGFAPTLAVEEMAAAYLDGKPLKSGKFKPTRKDRDGLFWSSHVVGHCGPIEWKGDAMSLALARYLAQDDVVIEGLVARVARESPETLVHAVRRSSLVLKPDSPRRVELQRAGAESEVVAELCRVLDVFALAHGERVKELEARKVRLAGLSAIDLLLYASLYAFEMLAPRNLSAATWETPSGIDVQVAWDAIGDLLTWKLGTVSSASLSLTDESIGKSISRHLRPILFDPDSPNSWSAVENLRAFHALMAAQVELNEFISRSADAFSYDDAIRFGRHGNRLEIIEVDPEARTLWNRDGERLARFHGYWFHRAVDEYIQQVKADPAKLTIGKPENADANRLAWLRALQAQLRLREVYGVADEVKTDSGHRVDLFQSLLSLNLMSAFFQQDFLVAFAGHLHESGNWIGALQRLIMGGFYSGFQNRLPLTWSGWDEKISRITGWTVTASKPMGDPGMASSILDFWTYDMAAMASRIQSKEPGLQPELFERPVMKFGKILVQLPWVVGLQNNSAAAINNLRRLGARRDQARDETSRIEVGLAGLFEERGFKVLCNWTPSSDQDNAGEVDLIAFLDGCLLVVEVKSTFLRRLKKDAWLHASTTLRKAGRQVGRKLKAVSQAIASDTDFRAQLGLAGSDAPSREHAWIADTSIESDHQRFGGYLKVSIEEIIIALRDDRHLLRESAEVLAGELEVDLSSEDGERPSNESLYPDGFTAGRFIEVMETEAVWSRLG